MALGTVARGAAAQAAQGALSESLEDYLEIILALAARSPGVRVRDIARAKGVRMPSVTAALHRLAGGGFVDYAARECVTLTPAGVAVARRVAGRHRFLIRFLAEILGVPRDVARRDACGLEHHLSAQTLERLAGFVEYLETCPEVGASLLARFRGCFRHSGELPPPCPVADCAGTRTQPRTPRRGAHELRSIAQLQVGEEGEVVRIRAAERLRIALMRRGLIPGVRIKLLRRGGPRRPALVDVQGQGLRVAPQEAREVFVDTRPMENADGA